MAILSPIWTQRPWLSISAGHLYCLEAISMDFAAFTIECGWWFTQCLWLNHQQVPILPLYKAAGELTLASLLLTIMSSGRNTWMHTQSLQRFEKIILVKYLQGLKPHSVEMSFWPNPYCLSLKGKKPFNH
jgi:hypothetical protein